MLTFLFFQSPKNPGFPNNSSLPIGMLIGVYEVHTSNYIFALQPT